MKRKLFAMVTLLFCFVLFMSGCSPTDEENDTPGAFCQVLNSDDDGMYVWTEDFGHIYVKFDNSNLEISPLDTVVIEFSESDLISTNGQFTDYFGEERGYLHILENPQNIRHTMPGEPTFG